MSNCSLLLMRLATIKVRHYKFQGVSNLRHCNPQFNRHFHRQFNNHMNINQIKSFSSNVTNEKNSRRDKVLNYLNIVLLIFIFLPYMLKYVKLKEVEIVESLYPPPPKKKTLF